MYETVFRFDFNFQPNSLIRQIDLSLLRNGKLNTAKTFQRLNICNLIETFLNL